MVVILKGTINPRSGGHKERVEVINGHTTPLWPNDHYAKILQRIEHWLQTTEWVYMNDPRTLEHLELQSEAWIAERCHANFYRLVCAEPEDHTHTPWVLVWGSLRGYSFCSRNLVQMLYSPEWRVGIVRQAFRLAPNRKPGRAYKRLVGEDKIR